jgi:hypothetical protein
MRRVLLALGLLFLALLLLAVVQTVCFKWRMQGSGPADRQEANAPFRP